jgi:hypothetical protein
MGGASERDEYLSDDAASCAFAQRNSEALERQRITTLWVTAGFSMRWQRSIQVFPKITRGA